MFPALFVTIACGAISGFHSLVGSGTTAKQLDKESDAQPIAYGGMLIECALALISLCAVGYIWSEYVPNGITTPTAGICNRYLPHVCDDPVPCRCRGCHLCNADPCGICILPDLSGYCDPSGTLHVPGVLA